MTRVTIDESGLTRIPDITASFEFCDNAGKTLGFFYPVVEEDKSIYANLKCPVSDEELERRSREESGSSLAEIWKRLGVK